MHEIFQRLSIECELFSSEYIVAKRALRNSCS